MNGVLTLLEVRNPATGEEIAQVRAYSAAEVEGMIDAADAARAGWAGMTAGERAKVLRRWFDLVQSSSEDLAQTMTLESGKPLREARAEVAYGAAYIDWFAEEGRRAYGETIPTFDSNKRIFTVRQPIGTCAAITPWNFPLAMITRKVAPALAAGCSIVVKPAEATPLTALALERLAHEAGVPRDLFRVAPTTDPAAIGKVFCGHPLVRKLSFTGSTAVGKILMEQAAQNVIKLSLELGGNAPFIVFDDADLDAAIEGLMLAKFRNAGQTCVCANRILVQRGVHDAFVDRLAERVRALQVGDGMDEGTAIGPLIDPAARTKVQGLIDRAVESGASLVAGADCEDAGPCHVAPSVLTGVTAKMDIARQEIFGPVAAVIAFDTEEEAVRIANDTPFGLAAYFYTRDYARVWRVMEGLEYGMVAANEGGLSTEVAPFGGIKQSGLGREGARQGLEEYLEIKYCVTGNIGG